jgi:hypothetical protein
LPDGWDGFEFRGGGGGEIEGFDLFVEGGFAGVIEAEEEDGIFYRRSVKNKCMKHLVPRTEHRRSKSGRKGRKWEMDLLCLWHTGTALWLNDT